MAAILSRPQRAGHANKRKLILIFTASADVPVHHDEKTLTGPMVVHQRKYVLLSLNYLWMQMLQDCSISIDNALEILQSCIKPSI